MSSTLTCRIRKKNCRNYPPGILDLQSLRGPLPPIDISPLPLPPIHISPLIQDLFEGSIEGSRILRAQKKDREEAYFDKKMEKLHNKNMEERFGKFKFLWSFDGD